MSNTDLATSGDQGDVVRTPEPETTPPAKPGEARRISPCPACGGELFRKRFTKGSRDFWRCTRCGVEKQFPLPSLEELTAYYDRSYGEGMYKEFVAARPMKVMTAKHRFRQIAPHCLRGRWLDVGCSDGRFVEQARAEGIDAEGIEVSEVAVNAARAEGLPVSASTLESFRPVRDGQDVRYQTITAFDVLEHVLDPIGFLQAAHRVLVPGGFMALTLPNRASLTRLVMGKRWYFYIPEEHLHYFDPSTIRLLLARAGFTVVRCTAAHKPLSFEYSLVQFREYNPLIYRLLSPISRIMPRPLREAALPLSIGEMLVIARRSEGD